MKQIFITGGTGYMGSRLIKRLFQRGYAVKALVRSGSQAKLPVGCNYVIANPFGAASFIQAIAPGATFIQLLGVTHPSSKKKALFKTVDFASVKASVDTVKKAGAAHFIYVSVAQTPTRIMHDYQQGRAAGETYIRSAGLPATFIRPWYVVGPGHYWLLLFYRCINYWNGFRLHRKKQKHCS